MRVPELNPGEWATLYQIAAEIRDHVREKGARGPALLNRLAEDYERVNGYVDAIYEEMGKLGLKAACHAGCGWCCHTSTVYVSEPEAFYLARYIEQSEHAAQFKEKVRATADVLRGMSDEDRLRKPVPCPMLDRQAGKCMVYEARPFVCRTHNSLSWMDCKKAFRTGQSYDRARSIRPALMLGVVARQGYVHGLEQAGLPAKGVELVSALATIFSTKNAYKRWADGEDIFADARNRRVERSEATPAC